MQKKIETQTKTIEYIKSKYKQKTGEQIVMPKSWEQYLSMPEQQVPAQPLPIESQNLQPQTFVLAIDAMNLPSRLSFNKLPYTSFNPSNKFHMIESFSLSGYQFKGFSKNLFREFLNRIVEMRCLKMIDLSGNGIGDQCAEEIQAILNIKRITRINFSKNNFGKTCLQIVSKNFNHIQWIDLSRNSFTSEKTALTQLLNSIRTNGKIFHIQMDFQDERQINQFASYVKIKPHIRSFGPIDSKISFQSMEYICQVLESKDQKKQSFRVFNLNFEYCFLENKVFSMLGKSISINNTLIKLSLKGNQLGQQSIISFCQVLESNLTLIEINLSGNCLEDKFSTGLSKMLAKNDILQIVDISKNNIGIDGAKQIYSCLSQSNDTIQSLGRFQTNERMGQQMIQKLKKALRINRVSKDIRAKIVAENSQLSVTEITNRQTQAFLESEYQEYELLEPIAMTNPIVDDPYKINIWKFE